MLGFVVYLSCRDHFEIMYCTSSVSLSMKTISGTRFIVDLSSSLISSFTVQSFKIELYKMSVTNVSHTLLVCQMGKVAADKHI